MARSEPTTVKTGSSDIFKRIRQIEIRTSRLVNNVFGGRYLSTFKGRGMEFSDVREYVPGDDIRNIHWRITAKLGHPYIKRFVEERELTILVAVDVSASQTFGTRTRFKSELATELVALLGFSALKNNDKIGLLLFSDKIESYVPPRKSQSHTLRMIRDTLSFIPQSKGTNIDGALQYLNRVQKKRCVLFLISDFNDSNYETALRLTHQKHDLIVFGLEDSLEKHWPVQGRFLLEDAETGERQLFTPNKTTLKNYGQLAHTRRSELQKILQRNGIDYVFFSTNQDYVKPLMGFFRSRLRRQRGAGS